VHRAVAAVALELTFFALAFGWRSWIQWRRTGSTGFIRDTTWAAVAGGVLGVAGVVLLVLNWVSVASLVVLVVALEVQVRLVEEPYLRTVHGPRYDAYCSTVGRFLPRIGIAPRRPRGT
jgi:protein-S-isoprenylcysteine O-methyltransferase Ste14